MKNESEKGVSLIMTFFIMTIMLAIVLSVSLVLYDQIKIIRNIGNSIVSFYAADGGVEKFLYYDRKKIPEGGVRGLCNICSNCPSNGPDDFANCVACRAVSGTDCDPITCANCEIYFETSFETRSYKLTGNVSEQINGDFLTDVNSRGAYYSATRAVELQITKAKEGNEIVPMIEDATLSSRSIEQYTELTVSAIITDANGIDENRVVAHIQSPDGVDFVIIPLANTDPGNLDFYSGIWVGTLPDAYYADIVACDVKDVCTVLDNI
jgi:hypothetical protein